MSKTILAEVDGFTPLMDVLLPDVGVIGAAVFGRMWRYCQMENGICHAKLESIAGELNISTRTVMRHSDDLVKLGYLKDLTPDLRNRPHRYADTGKAGLSIQIAGVTKSHSDNLADCHDKLSEQSDFLSQSAMTKSHLKIEEKKEAKKESKKELAKPKKSKTAKETDPLLQHPAVVAYRDIMHLTPNDVQRTLIAERVGANGHIEDWRTVLTDWKAHAWKPGNVPGQLEKFAERIGAQYERTQGHADSGKAANIEPTPEQLAAAERINAARAARGAA